jgi:glucose/mannose-6-phosphate isomerase
MKTLTELRGLHDSQNVLASIELFKQQCEEGYARGKALAIDPSYRDIDNIVFAGMGGSALPASILRSWNLLAKPSVVWNRYNTPVYMNEKTLFVGMSYSGTTEETLAATKTAFEKGAQTLGVTVGGTLAQILEGVGKPVCFVDEASNPCKQPRFAVGFMLGALIGIFESLGLFTENLDIEKALASLGKETSLDDASADARLAQSLAHKIPVVVAAEHLAEVAHFFQNQLNETGKTFAIAHEIPEVNHHLLESLGNPTTNKDNLVFVFMQSPYYNDRNKKRFSIMRELVEKAGIQTLEYARESGSWLEEAYLFMQSVEYTSYYLGLYHECDPSDIPFVTYFKNELVK